MIRRVGLIAGTIFTEALRRREIYVIALVTIALLLAASSLRFFQLESLHKFYYEFALKTMSVAAAVTTVVLAGRQLPREFERRTIYTLLARPLSRWEFLLGKYLGVLGAGLFCLGLFLTVFLAGTVVTGVTPGLAIFAQFVYLQALALAMLAALAFMLSLLMGFDAAITSALLLYMLGAVLTNAMVLLYDYVGGAGQLMLAALNWLVPQPALLDLSAKVIHGWEPLSAGTLAQATFYALMFVVPYLMISYLLLRRRPL